MSWTRKLASLYGLGPTFTAGLVVYLGGRSAEFSYLFGLLNRTWRLALSMAESH